MAKLNKVSVVAAIKTPPDLDKYDFEKSVEVVKECSKRMDHGQIDIFLRLIDVTGGELSHRGVLVKLYKWYDVLEATYEIMNKKLPNKTMLVKQTFGVIVQDTTRYVPLSRFKEAVTKNGR